MSNNNLETLVIKYSLGSAFIGVTALFVVKIVMLLGEAIKQEIQKLKEWLLSGAFAVDAFEFLRNMLFGG